MKKDLTKYITMGIGLAIGQKIVRATEPTIDSALRAGAKFLKNVIHDGTSKAKDEKAA